MNTHNVMNNLSMQPSASGRIRWIQSTADSTIGRLNRWDGVPNLNMPLMILQKCCIWIYLNSTQNLADLIRLQLSRVILQIQCNGDRLKVVYVCCSPAQQQNISDLWACDFSLFVPSKDFLLDIYTHTVSDHMLEKAKAGLLVYLAKRIEFRGWVSTGLLPVPES